MDATPHNAAIEVALGVSSAMDTAAPTALHASTPRNEGQAKLGVQARFGPPAALQAPGAPSAPSGGMGAIGMVGTTLPTSSSQTVLAPAAAPTSQHGQVCLSPKL